VSNQRVAFLTPGQAKALLDAIKGKSLQLWCHCVLGLYAGLRFSEVAGIELSDIKFDAGTIHIRDPKGGPDRFAYITQPITDMFNEWWTVADKKPGLVFPARVGGRQKRVSPVFARTVDELGLNDGVTDSRQRLVYHSLRHSFASWLVMGGESLQTVKELMGHKDIQTTMRYSHLAPDIKRNAVDNLVSTLNPGDHGKRKIIGLNDNE
jgi:integrase